MKTNLENVLLPKDISEVESQPLRLGAFEVLPIPTGIFGLDGGAMFGTVPKVLWNKSNPADESNRIPMEARALLLKSATRNILIDCGNGADFIAKYGQKLGPKFAEMYNITEAKIQDTILIKALEFHGVKADQITDVILTHLHFDHCGGGVTVNNKNELVPTFANAKYYVQKGNYLNAKTPNIREKASYFAANFQPLIDHGVLNFIDGSATNIIPDINNQNPENKNLQLGKNNTGIQIDAFVSHGHTSFHQSIIIQEVSLLDANNGATKNKKLLYCGDLIPTSSHVRLAWVMGYDLNPLTIIEEKRQILQKAAAENWYLFFEHDPYCDMAMVKALDPTSNNTDFAVLKRFNL